jgi:ribose 5-phosphate isomerase A
VCLVDSYKLVDTLGRYPLPVEVIDMGRSSVARRLVSFGGMPELRKNFRSEHDHPLLDVYNLDLTNPIAMERKIQAIPGVVTVGLFAHRPADILVSAGPDGVEVLERPRLTEHHP